MKVFAFLYLVVFASFGVFALDAKPVDTKEQLTLTLACQRDIEEIGSPYAEIFKSEGIVYSKQDSAGVSDGEKGERRAMKFIFADKDGVSTVLSPYPMTQEKDPDGKVGIYEKQYHTEHRFQLVLPKARGGKKTYCFNYTVNWVFNDETSLQASPSARCAGQPVRTAVAKNDNGLLADLKILQEKMAYSLSKAMSAAEDYGGKNSASDETKTVIANLAKFNPQKSCAKLAAPDPDLKSALERFEKKRKLYTHPDGGATDSGTGVQ